MADNIIPLYNPSKFQSGLNTFQEIFSDPSVDGFQGKVILPLDFSLEMDGLSGIIPNSAFEIPKENLSDTYLVKSGEDVGKPRIAFILHSINQNFNNNKWTTKLTGQTLNIRFDALTEAEKSQIEKFKTDHQTIEGQIQQAAQTVAVNVSKLSLTGTYYERAYNLISSLEGYLSKAKWDVNHYRAGFGTDNKVLANGQVVTVTSNTTFTKEEARQTLIYDIKQRFEPSIIRVLGKDTWSKLNDNQKAAIISYSYNAGAGALNEWKITQDLKSGNYGSAAQKLSKNPITAKGKILNNLIERRKKEYSVFIKP